MVFAMNPRRKRRRSKSRRLARNSRRTRRFSYRKTRRNSGFSGTLGSVTSGFNIGLLKTGGLVVAGSIGNNWLTKQLIRLIPISILQTTPGNYITGLLGAGILGLIARTATPSLAAPVFFGGVLDVVMRATNQYVLPMLRLTPLKGLADYLTVGNAASARPLMGMEDYLTVGNAADARPLMGYEEYTGVDGYDDNNVIGVGDYLTVGNAAGARPLFGMGEGVTMGQETESEELACM